jgi:CHASE2 domain-containing sensor protein
MPPPLTSEENRRRTRKIWRDVRVSVILTIAILSLKWGFEHTEFGDDLRILAHKYLLQRLVSTQRASAAPIAIVDISDLEADCSNKATSREKLLKLINAIAKQRPLAIGVDIDFSPNQQGYWTPDDPNFFQSCLDITSDKDNPVPVVLGIERAQEYEPIHWLGAIRYKDLAASIYLPQKDTRKLWSWIKPKDHVIPTMAAALAQKISPATEDIPKGLGWAVHQFDERDLGGGYLVNEYIVDYSPLDSIEDRRLQTFQSEGIDAQPQLLNEKIVIIGNATLGKATDTFPVPVRQAPVPGIYLHACGAYTLATSHLYELSGLGRVALDALLALMIISAIASVRLYFKQDVNVHWLQGALTLAIVIIALIVGLSFVHITHVMWDDFLLVIIGLLLHRPVERWSGSFWRFITQDVIPWLKGRVLRNPKEVQNE